jgi:hypothetical protein
MNNTLKSFNGKPITNLYYAVNQYLNGNSNHWTNSGAMTVSDNDTSIPPPIPSLNNGLQTNLPSNLRITGATTTTIGNQQVGMNVTTVSPSTQYTMSVYIYYKGTGSVFGGNGSTPYMRTNVNNNSLATFGYNGDTNSANWPKNTWIRITATGTTQANENGVYLSSYIGNYVGDAVYYYGYQVEQGSFATPLVAGTRSSTQVVRDLTGNNTLTASGLTYNSDGTYSFDGSGGMIYFSENSLFNTQTPTVEVWVKTNATTQNGFWFEKGNVNTQYALFQEGANITWRHTTNPGGGSLTAPTASYMSTSAYAQVVGTYTNGDRRIYVNGVQVASDALSYTLPTNANGCSIGVYGGANGGRGYWYNGNIAIVRVYNKTLSAAEVKQNYDATRSRFGL